MIMMSVVGHVCEEIQLEKIAISYDVDVVGRSRIVTAKKILLLLRFYALSFLWYLLEQLLCIANAYRILDWKTIHVQKKNILMSWTSDTRH